MQIASTKATRDTVVAFVTLAVGLTVIGPVLADGVVRDGVGAVSSGRGGTNLAHSDTGAVLLDNPAGLVNIEGVSLFELSNDILFTDLDYSDPENDTSSRFRASYLPTATYIRRDPDGWWAAGVGFYAPAGFSAQWHLNSPLFGRHGYKSLAALTKILPAVAVGVTDRLSVGGSLGVAISHAELESPFFLQTGALAGVPTLFDLQATGAAPAWGLGLQYQLGDCTTLGVAYTGETRFRMDGNLDAEVLGLAPLPVHSDFDAQLDFVWPRSLGVGVKHNLSAASRFSADVIWYDWSHAFEEVDLELTDASNPLFPALLGPKIRDTFPLDWDDSVSWRFGYERLLTECDVVRAGYVFHPNPIPSSTLTPLIPAILEHAISVGYGRRWGPCRLDLAYQYSFGPKESTTVSGVVGGDFDFGEIKSQAHWVFASFSYEF